jgi:hypothetical protein
LAEAFRVTANPPPTIDNVTPGSGIHSANTDVTITGCNFRDPATVDLVGNDGTLYAAANESVPACDGEAICPDGSDECSMTATLPTNGLEVGAYLVRVTNTDENTWGDWSLFVVTEPAAKLDPDGWALSAATLETARRAHASVAGRIDNANRFLYVAGGDTGAGGTSLDTVEVIPLDLFGAVGEPFTQRNRLAAARSGLGLVQRRGYLYAVGGTTDLAAGLATVERAKILDFSDVPAPTAVPDAGTLAAGTWYYQVSAIKDANDPDNPEGETLPSEEVVISLGQDGGVLLSWPAVTGAQKYLIYRTELVDGVSSTEVYLDETAMTSYLDDGTATPDTTVTPLRRGSTGVWVTLADTLVRARFDLGATIANAPDGQLYLYALGGFGDCDGNGTSASMDCYEYATLSNDGSALGAFTNVEKTVMGMTTLTGLSTVRRVFGATTGNNANSSQIPSPDAYVFAIGGIGAGNDGEALKVQNGGTLAAPAILEPPSSALINLFNGHALQIINNAMYLIGGSDTTNAVLPSTRFSVRFNTVTGVPFRDAFSNAVEDMNEARWRHTVTLESGYFYAIGGSTDDAKTNATSSIELIIH